MSYCLKQMLHGLIETSCTKESFSAKIGAVDAIVKYLLGYNELCHLEYGPKKVYQLTKYLGTLSIDTLFWAVFQMLALGNSISVLLTPHAPRYKLSKKLSFSKI